MHNLSVRLMRVCVYVCGTLLKKYQNYKSFQTVIQSVLRNLKEPSDGNAFIFIVILPFLKCFAHLNF